MKKGTIKTISILLTLAMLLGMFPAAFASEAESVLQITGQPVGAEYTQGEDAEPLTVEAVAGEEDALSYQWYAAEEGGEGAPIEGAVEASYVPDTETVGTTYYFCVVTAGEETANTETVSVTVVEAQSDSDEPEEIEDLPEETGDEELPEETGDEELPNETEEELPEEADEDTIPDEAEDGDSQEDLKENEIPLTNEPAAVSIAAQADLTGAWDGVTLDFSWYNPNVNTLTISNPAQWASLAWIVSDAIVGFEETAEEYGLTCIGEIPSETDSFAGKTILLDADLDMGGVKSGSSWSGPNYVPIGNRNAGLCYLDSKDTIQFSANYTFNGSVDGQGHRIYNIYANYSVNGGNVGLFGAVGGSVTTISNLWIEGSFTALSSMGGLIADGREAANLTIENCVNNVALTGTSGSSTNKAQGMGGFIGHTFSATLRNCANLAKITSTTGKLTAGLVGSCSGVHAYNCYNLGTITVPSTGGGGAALLCDCTNGGRYAQPEYLSNCYYTGSSVAVWGSTKDNTSYATACYSFNVIDTDKLAALLNGSTTRVWVDDAELGVVPRVFSSNPDLAIVTGVEMLARPSKLEYIEGQTFDPAGMVVSACYSDGTYDALDNWKISRTEPFTEADAEAGTVMVTISGSYLSYAYSYDLEVTVTARALSSISIETQPQYKYYEGEKLDLSTMVVSAYFTDSTNQVKLSPEEYTTTMADGAELKMTDYGTVIVVSYTYRGVTKTAKVSGLQILSAANMPERDEDGTYLISNADELDWFVVHINQFYKIVANARLTADITANSGFQGIDYSYYGTFDGDGHTVTANINGKGFVQDLYGTVKNLTLNGSVTSTSYGVGGIAGSMMDSQDSCAMIINCVNNANVTGSYHVGGIVGEMSRIWTDNAVIDCVNNGTVISTDSTYFNGVGGIAGTLASQISGCVNTGAVQSNGNSAGGIVGIGNYGYAKVSNCYNVGTVTTTNANYMGGIMGWNNDAGVVVENCYNAGSLKAGTSTAGGGVIGSLYSGSYGFTNNYYLAGTAATGSAGTVVTADALKGLAGTLGSAYTADAANINQGYPVLTWQVSEDGNDGPIPIQDSEGTYLIKTAEQLDWFRTNHNGASAKLMADIETTSSFTGISYYRDGTFDGQGHTVTLNGKAALFPYVTDAVIRNVTIAGTVTTTGNYVAGLAGTTRGDVTIENCVNRADITGGDYVAGIVAYEMDGTLTIVNCANYGAITGTNRSTNLQGQVGGIAAYLKARDDSTTLVSSCVNTGAVSSAGARAVGGIVGNASAWGDTFHAYIIIVNCYNSAPLSNAIGMGEGGNLGGILGYSSEGVTLKNCYNSGTVTITQQDNTTYPGGIIGLYSGTISNCCYLEGTAQSGEASWSIASTYGVEVVSAETLKSAAMLNKLNADGLAFVADTNGSNSGYPVLAWQAGERPVLENVIATGSPQTQYTAGAAVSMGDLVLTACYSGGYTAELTDYTVTPAVLSMGVEEIVVSVVCEGQSYSFRFAVQVSEAPELKDGYYQLRTAADLDWFAKWVNEQPNLDEDKQPIAWNAKLINDIDASRCANLPIGQTYGHYFLGEFDGNGYTITLNLNGGQNNTALIANVDGGAYIHDLTVNGSVTAYGTVAGIVAQNWGNMREFGTVRIENCRNDAVITAEAGSYAGGILARDGHSICYTQINGCINTGDINGVYLVGGIVGYSSSTVTNCYNTGSVTGASQAIYTMYYGVGGIVGRQTGSGAIDHCYNIGAISGDMASSILGMCDSTGVTMDADFVLMGETAYRNFTGKAPAVGQIYQANETTMKSATAIGYLGDAYRQDVYGLNNGYPILVWQLDQADLTDISFTITTQPESFTCLAGGEAKTLTVEVSASAGASLSYQWYCNTAPTTVGAALIEGATKASYTPDVSKAGELVYYCVVTNTQGGNTCSVTSAAARVTVEEASYGEPTLDQDGFYPLASAKDLDWFAEKVANGETKINAKLTADIVASGSFSGFQQSTDAAAFAGIFDGNGHSLEVYLTDSHGLFYFMAGTVRNLTLKGSVEGASLYHVGGIAGNVRTDGQIIDCVNNAVVSAGEHAAGGITGYVNGNVLISGCVNNGTVTGMYCVGGIVGWCTYSTAVIADCVNHGTITANQSSSTSYGVGGVVGSCAGTISGCINTGAVNAKAYIPTGGIAGTISGKPVYDCYNTGTVTNTAQASILSRGVGGLIGTISGTAAVVENCYNIGTVNAAGITAGVGGAIGKSPSAAWTGASNVYYLDGCVNGTLVEAGGAAISSGELKELASTLGEAWNEDTGSINNGYPILAWQGGSKPGAETIEITVDLGNSGAAITAPEGGWTEGENTFTVSNDLACVVAVSYDGGVTYERLTAAANGDGTYSFTANLTEGASIAVVLKGDANGDGQVDMFDAVAIVQNQLIGNSLSGLAADITKDGDIDMFDALEINNIGSQGLDW